MFCEKCGAQLPDVADFCTNCGTSIARGGIKATAEIIPDTEIQLKVKPSFKFGYIILPSLIFYTIMVLIFSLILSALSSAAGLISFLIGFTIVALILGIKTAFNKKQYNSISYEFYKTKVVYRDSFLNLSEKEVKYKYVREVAMGQTFIQRFFNIGNIVIFTNAESGLGNGIFIKHVENVQSVYKEIKSIIKV